MGAELFFTVAFAVELTLRFYAEGIRLLTLIERIFGVSAVSSP